MGFQQLQPDLRAIASWSEERTCKDGLKIEDWSIPTQPEDYQQYLNSCRLTASSIDSSIGISTRPVLKYDFLHQESNAKRQACLLHSTCAAVQEPYRLTPLQAFGAVYSWFQAFGGEFLCSAGDCSSL